MALDRPEWNKCALTGLGVPPERKTWCGRTPDAGEWCFADVSHAAINGRAKGRLVLCGDCRDEIVEALDNGAWEPAPTTTSRYNVVLL